MRGAAWYLVLSILTILPARASLAQADERQLIQLEAKVTELALRAIHADATGKEQVEARVARLTERTFVWVLERKQMWLQWYEDPSILPLRVIGKEAVPWLLDRLRAGSVPERRGGVADGKKLCVTLLGEFGDASVAPVLHGLLYEEELSNQLALQDVTRALLKLGSNEGIEWCVDALDREETYENRRHAAEETLVHVIGDSVLRFDGYRSWREWWGANEAKPIKDWGTGVAMHMH